MVGCWGWLGEQQPWTPHESSRGVGAIGQGEPGLAVRKNLFAGKTDLVLTGKGWRLEGEERWV